MTTGSLQQEIILTSYSNLAWIESGSGTLPDTRAEYENLSYSFIFLNCVNNLLFFGNSTADKFKKEFVFACSFEYEMNDALKDILKGNATFLIDECYGYLDSKPSLRTHNPSCLTHPLFDATNPLLFGVLSVQLCHGFDRSDHPQVPS